MSAPCEGLSDACRIQACAAISAGRRRTSLRGRNRGPLCSVARCSMGIVALAVAVLVRKPAKIGTKVVRHGRCVTFQMVEVAVPRNLFGKSCGGSMNCDQDPRRRRPRESTARRKRHEGCVWMTTKLAEWASGHRQPTKIELSGRLRRMTLPMTAQFK